MSYQAFFIKSLLIFLCGCCCSFSAVPMKQAPPQKTPSVKVKRQQKRLQRRLHRANKPTRLQKLQKPPKKHAVFNLTGFFLIIGSITFAILGFFAIIAIFGIFGALVNTLLGVLLGIVIGGGVAGFILCIIGLAGSKEAENPKTGFGIAGVCIMGIPILIGIIGLFIALFRAVGALV